MRIPFLLILLTLSTVPAVSAQTAATVDGQAIDVADVGRHLKSTYGNRKIAEDALPRLQAHALKLLIDRRVVGNYLAKNEAGVDDEAVTLELTEFKKRLEKGKLSFADFLKTKGHTEESFRRLVAWQMSWRRFTARRITKKVLADTFAKHRREFDGTKLRVSHLLLQAKGTSADATKDLVDRAAKIRQQIADGTLTFETAVEQHSAGSKKDGGDLGFVRRHNDMSEPFSRAAFRLAKKGEISQPVVSPAGVHLIRWTEIQPGKGTLEDDKVRQRVEQFAAARLFAEIATSEGKTARITFSGKAPYFDTETGKLMVP